MDECRGRVQAFLHPAREPLGPLVADVVEINEVDEVDEVVDALVAFVAENAVRFAGEAEVLSRSEFLVDARLLKSGRMPAAVRNWGDALVASPSRRPAATASARFERRATGDGDRAPARRSVVIRGQQPRAHVFVEFSTDGLNGCFLVGRYSL